MILIVDPISIPTVDLRTLPPPRGGELFVKAVRPITRELLYSPEGTWNRYRSGQLTAVQLQAVTSAVEAYLTPLPEFARVTMLGMAHDGGGSFTGKILAAQDESAEIELLKAFWKIAAKAAGRGYTIVSFGGTSFGGPFLLRRSRLLGLTPSLPIPVGRFKIEAHFDLAAVLSNWDRSHEFSLELWAHQYGIAGPWEQDTAETIRALINAGEVDDARKLEEVRLEAIYSLYQHLAPAYAA